ncbi:MAG: ester cyclase [Bacteroidota bacterium]
MHPTVETVQAFNQLVGEFKYEEAHAKFYHADLVKHENEDAPTIGLENHKTEMQQFLGSISNRFAKLIKSIVSDDMSVSEWHYKFDHKDWGARDFREISIQRWKDGKIIHERHHYKTENW